MTFLYSSSKGARIRFFASVLLFLGVATSPFLLGKDSGASSSPSALAVSKATMTADLARAFQEAEPLRHELRSIRLQFLHGLSPEQRVLALEAFEEDFGNEISRLAFLDHRIAVLSHDIHVEVSRSHFLDRDEADLIAARREMYEAAPARQATARLLVTDLEVNLKGRERAVNNEVETLIAALRAAAQTNQNQQKKED